MSSLTAPSASCRGVAPSSISSLVTGLFIQRRGSKRMGCSGDVGLAHRQGGELKTRLNEPEKAHAEQVVTMIAVLNKITVEELVGPSQLPHLVEARREVA